MKTLNVNLVTGLAILLIACGGAKKEYDAKGYSAAPANEYKDVAGTQDTKQKEASGAEDKSEHEQNPPVSSSAAVEKNKDTTRKFIRTADLKFKVKNVINATYSIEDIINKQGGFVSYTNLGSKVNYVNSTAISADTTLETTYFTVENTMVLRVPNTKLDTTLKEIAGLIDFLDYRIIKAEDVALQILSNKLTQIRAAKNEQRLTNAIDNRGKKLNETAAAEELLLNKQEQADNAKIANLGLNDQIKFSTINLSLYQRQSIKRELISNDKNIAAYEPSFGSKLLEGLKYGWGMLQGIVLFFVQIWAVLVIGLLIFIAVRLYVKRAK